MNFARCGDEVVASLRKAAAELPRSMRALRFHFVAMSARDFSARRYVSIARRERVW